MSKNDASVQRAKTVLVAAGLSEAFVWASTEQGHEYWGEVLQNLCKIAGVSKDAIWSAPHLEVPDYFRTITDAKEQKEAA